MTNQYTYVCNIVILNYVPVHVTVTAFVLCCVIDHVHVIWSLPVIHGSYTCMCGVLLDCHHQSLSTCNCHSSCDNLTDLQPHEGPCLVCMEGHVSVSHGPGDTLMSSVNLVSCYWVTVSGMSARCDTLSCPHSGNS